MNKLDLESNSREKIETVKRKWNRKPSIDKSEEIKCSNRYESLYKDDSDDEPCDLYDSITSSESRALSYEISHEIPLGNIQKKKKIEKLQRKRKKRKGRTKIMLLRKRDKIANAKFQLLK